MVILSIILLKKTKNVIVKKNKIINYKNYYFLINNTIDILKLIQLFVKKCNF